MLATAVVEQIQQMLLERRLSQRKIALRLGISRGTVNAVARGRRRNRLPGHNPRNEGFQTPSGRFMRCPKCGGMVQMPCLLCYLRERTRKNVPSERV